MQDKLRTFWKILQNGEINFHLEFLAMLELVIDNKKELLADLNLSQSDIKTLILVCKKLRQGAQLGCKELILKGKDQYQDIMIREIRKSLK